MDNTYWHYFLSLEKDFLRTIDYVEICDVNSKSISIRYLQLLLAIGSEVDVTLKRLCRLKSPKVVGRSSNIDNYRENILKKYPGFLSMVVEIPRYNRKIEPWESWKNLNNPCWWHAYNNLKHERNKYFFEANQKNAIESLCGLFCVLLYLYVFTNSEYMLIPWSDFFDCKGSPGNLMLDTHIQLPDTNQTIPK